MLTTAYYSNSQSTGSADALAYGSVIATCSDHLDRVTSVRSQVANQRRQARVFVLFLRSLLLLSPIASKSKSTIVSIHSSMPASLQVCKITRNLNYR